MSERSEKLPRYDELRRCHVVTYQLAYLTWASVDLCRACVERDDHECGVIGSVEHGLHLGYCDGAHHGARKGALDVG